MDPWPDDRRHNAAAMALQIYAGLDPDGSRFVARKLLTALDRAGTRPTDGLPTDDEVDRALRAFERRAHEIGGEITRDDVYAALLDALCPGLAT